MRKDTERLKVGGESWRGKEDRPSGAR